MENVDLLRAARGDESVSSVWARFEGGCGGVDEHGVSYRSRARLSIYVGGDVGGRTKEGLSLKMKAR